MSLRIKGACIVGWIACGILSAGFRNAHLAADYCYANPRAITFSDRTAWRHLSFSMADILFGPFALILAPFTEDFFIDGWSLYPIRICLGGGD